MAWDLVCRPKQEGGIGIKDCVVWIEPAIEKYVWDITQKTDSMRVKWINHIYVKNVDWWHYNVPQDSSWYWKKICHIRDKLAGGYTQGGW